MKYRKITAVLAGIVMAMGMASPSLADSEATGVADGSPGVLSGNVIQIPVHVPVNVCGNTANFLALLNSAFGNICAND
ncbi:chaplin [Streptomyces formicae]|uniref:Chaplin n=1 Tax=Streptomyces formicae TaxID=1616117 RepID=A0ABY3WFL1_9ACTN|nr:chaplin [Streptomyces formicae]UNM10239.1 chaplin [Streptomyces formicae]